MYRWSKWRPFPDPRRGGILVAPYGPGVYELKNNQTGKFVLRGSGKNCAYRMSSILPVPLGQGNRKNSEKRQYILKHIANIDYRCYAFQTLKEAQSFEYTRKSEKPCLFNT